MTSAKGKKRIVALSRSKASQRSKIQKGKRQVERGSKYCEWCDVLEGTEKKESVRLRFALSSLLPLADRRFYSSDPPPPLFAPKVEVKEDTNT
jgi:hypothetical protein